MSAPRVAIIGGGAAGMIATLTLRARGVAATLLESSPQIGGVIRTVRRDGWIAEAGPNSLGEPEPAIRALLDGIGLADRTVRADPTQSRRYLLHQGKLVAVPRAVGELLAWPVLTASGRMRLLKEPFVKPVADDVEESVDAFVRRRLGDEMATHVFDPLVAASCAGDSRTVLMRYAFPRLVEWERLGGSLLKGSMRAGMEARRKAGKSRGVPAGPWSCPGGLAEIAERVADSLGGAVKTGVRIAAVAATGAGYEVTDTAGQRERFAAVIAAVPPRAFRDLRIDVPGAEILDAVDAVPHASLATVSLGFRRDQVEHPLDGHGLLTPSCERKQILGTLFASSLFSGRAPEGQVLLTSFVGGVGQERLASIPAAQLVDLVREELSGLLGITGRESFSEVSQWPASQPQAVAGHGARLAAVEALEAATPGLCFAGAWRDGLSLVDATRSGQQAADRVIEQLS